VQLNRSTFYYQATKPQDHELEKQLKELAACHPRWGVKKMTASLHIQGIKDNHKRIRRIYRDMGLNIRIKPKRRLPSREPVPLIVPEKPNVSWSVDFMSDALSSGKRFRTFNVIDDFNREVLWIGTDTSIPAQRVIRILNQIASLRDYPKQIRSDNGPEFLSHRVRVWARDHHVHWHFIQPGKPAQNAFIERFNRTFREDVLDAYLFSSVADIQAMAFDWMEMYNTRRPHEALDNLTPHLYSLASDFSS
jgi:putative transposase